MFFGVHVCLTVCLYRAKGTHFKATKATLFILCLVVDLIHMECMITLACMFHTMVGNKSVISFRGS